MNRIGWAAIVFILVLADQASKSWVEKNLVYQQLVELIPFLGFYRTHNTGIAFSFLSSLNGWLLIGFIVVVIGFILWLWRSLDPGRWISSLGYALVLSGAMGNLIDRISLGQVVDFILVHSESWSFAVFNLADAFITLGAAAIIIDEFMVLRKSRSPEN